MQVWNYYQGAEAFDHLDCSTLHECFAVRLEIPRKTSYSDCFIGEAALQTRQTRGPRAKSAVVHSGTGISQSASLIPCFLSFHDCRKSRNSCHYGGSCRNVAAIMRFIKCFQTSHSSLLSDALIAH